jgi:hypothetical protein
MSRFISRYAMYSGRNEDAKKATKSRDDLDCRIKAALCGWSVVVGQSNAARFGVRRRSAIS